MRALDAYVCDTFRTPRGRAGEKGSLFGTRPVDLLAPLYRAVQSRTDLASNEIDDVVLGCVTAVGDQGANIAKISALYAGLGERVAGITVNRFCASGLDAFVFAALKADAEAETLILAGGVESLSRAPIFSDRGAWFADPDVAQATGFVHMALAADLLASLEGIDRPELDAYAADSHRRAAAARDAGRFARTLVPVLGANGEILLARDELIRDGATAARMADISSSFAELADEESLARIQSRYPQVKLRHVHHVGSSPGLADGASVAVVASRTRAARHGLTRRARIRSFASCSVEPVRMLTGNVEAAFLALARTGMRPSDIDHFEVNESFAVVPLHFTRALAVDPALVNPCGGAIAMGHPLGATGGILIATAIDQLEHTGGGTALVSICGGAGVATAIILERT